MSFLLNTLINRTTNILKTKTHRLCYQANILANVKKFVPPVLGRSAQNSVRNFSTLPAYEVNTILPKDVILYKNDNPKFFRVINFFGICQFIFWIYLSHFSFTSLKDAPVEEKPDEELPWYQRINLGDNKFRNSITVFCFLLGFGILATTWMFTLRSVRFLILRKGGGSIAFVTYTPFGPNRIMTVPMKNISAQESRSLAKSMLPIKVQNRMLFYILDMRGEFRNPELFDYTAGLKRRLVT